MPLRVKLMNEYTIQWPLWIPGGPATEGDLPVSEGLAADLKAWAGTFNAHFDWQHGWDDPALVAEHALEAQRLRLALAEELGPDYEVVLDLWEAPAP